jgi:transcriptional regulator GlxA family with amidase domain
MDVPASEQGGRDRFIFVLMPGFAASDLGTGADVLNAANRAGASLGFCWRTASETGAPVTSSSGVRVAVDGALPPVRGGDCVVLCGGAPERKAQPGKALVSWLRRAMRGGAEVCALGDAVRVAADSGLAGGRRLSAHWMMHPVMTEDFPQAEITCSVFEQDRSLITCGGGAATLDLFISFVEQRRGPALASQVADLLLCASIRACSDRQTRNDQCRFGMRHPKLSEALALISRNIEEHLSPSDIAAQVGLSTRQLERLFQKYVGSSPKSYITELRLDRSRILLKHSSMRVIDVAIACGFSSAGHFSKLYRKRFGTSPHSELGIKFSGPGVVRAS